MSDSKYIDYQAGSESARSGLMAMLAGIDNVSGAGGLNVIAEMSIEKIVIDNDYIGTLKHLEKGIRFDEEALAADLMLKVGSGGNFLNQKHTLKNYKKRAELQQHHHELRGRERPGTRKAAGPCPTRPELM